MWSHFIRKHPKLRRGHRIDTFLCSLGFVFNKNSQENVTPDFIITSCLGRSLKSKKSSMTKQNRSANRSPQFPSLRLIEIRLTLHKDYNTTTMILYRSHALISLALLTAAGHSEAFQTPKPNTNTPKSSLDVSYLERSLEQPDYFFEPVETTIVKDVVEKHDEGLACKTELEKRLQKGASFQNTSLQRTAKQMMQSAASAEQ